MLHIYIISIIFRFGAELDLYTIVFFRVDRLYLFSTLILDYVCGFNSRI